MIKRRDFLKWVGTAGVGLAGSGHSLLGHASMPSGADMGRTVSGAAGRVVVIGGGMGGATVAKYLRLYGGSGLDVTLIERDAHYTANLMSNQILNGSQDMNTLKFSYGNLSGRYGVKIVRGEVAAIDPLARTVTLTAPMRYVYDRLVIAPGVDFDTLPGLETTAAQMRVPHAWKAGPQTLVLRNMIAGMPAGGIFVMGIPAAPFSCPSGPYERACIVADWLARNRPGAKVVVLDANPGIVAASPSFATAFAGKYRDIIEYQPGVTIDHVDSAAMAVHTSSGAIKGDVLNLIPPQRAGRVLVANGLADAGGRWTRVDARTGETSVAPGIHVIGDAVASTRPKSGQRANQEAKICADAILRLLAGRSPAPAPRFDADCVAPLAADTTSESAALLWDSFA